MKRLAKTLFYGVLLLTPAWAKADKAGEALLQKCVQAEGRLKSLTADIWVQDRVGAQIKTRSGLLKLKRPNFAHVTLTGASDEDNVLIHSDGKMLVQFQRATKEFLREPADGSGANVGRNALQEAAIFFNPDLLNSIRAQGTGLKVTGTVVVGKVNCKVLQVMGGDSNLTFKVYVGPDNLLHGVHAILRDGAGKRIFESRLTNLHADPVIPHIVFAWSLPKGAKPLGSGVARASGDQESAENRTQQESPLLPAGGSAPGFTLALANGGAVSLHTLTGANKVTLVNFWSYFCDVCRAELPHLDAMRKQFRGKGFEVLAIDSGDDAKTIRNLWASGRFTMPVAMNGEQVGELYKVQAIPTNYLIDRNGKILARFEGFDEAGIRAVLAKAGIK